MKSHDTSPSTPNYSRRRATAVAVGVLAGGATILGLTHDRGSSTTQDPAPVCIPSSETHTFTFKDGQGKNDAVFDIAGAGAGEGALCWDDAREIVEDELEAQSPYGNASAEREQTIEIPNQMIPVDQNPNEPGIQSSRE